MDEVNWAGNYRYGAYAIREPASVDDLQDLVARSPRLRAIGTRHTFNDIADTTGELVSIAKLPRRFKVDVDTRTATVDAGARYGDVAELLEARGWALGNLASLPHISIAGAIATATHGSGIGNGNLATSVAALELVRGDGERVRLRRGEDGFDGVVVGIGSLGIVTAVTLDIRPSFQVSQRVYRGLPWTIVAESFDAIAGAAYSVSLFTRFDADGITQAWLKSTDPDAVAADTFFGAPAATVPVHMLPGMAPANCTQQLGEPGPWHERLPHFRLAFTPSNGEEIQSEYLLPREHAVQAIDALRAVSSALAPVLQVSEIRTVAADSLWLSTAYQRDCVAFHFTWVRDQAAVEQALVVLEAALAPFDARPHWGKVYVDREGIVPSLYPRLNDFAALAERFDPRGVFRNAFVDRLLG